MKEIFSVKSSKYGTPTGTVTMPDAAEMTDLGENVKDQLTFEETEPTLENIDTEQGTRLRTVATAKGQTTFTLQYHDMSYDNLAAIKGGTSVPAVAGVSAAAWKPGTKLELKNKAFQVETDSGQYFNFYNALLVVTIGGKGTRAGYFYVQVKVHPQLTVDKAGDWEIRDVEVPAEG